MYTPENIQENTMNIFLRQILKFGLERAAYKSIRQYPQVVCFAHDSISRKIMIDGIFEKNELLALKSFLLSEPYARETCLDIGGNIGNHALFFASLFEQVISFEPNPKICQLLSINAGLTKNITAVNLGLGDQTDTLPAKVSNLNFGGARLTDGDDANTQFSLMALDDYLLSAAPRSISFIKMAAGGYELKALEGASDTLQKHQPILAIELHVRKDQSKTDSILAFLSRQGYGYAHIFKPKIFSINRPRFIKIPISEFSSYPVKNHKLVAFTFD